MKAFSYESSQVWLLYNLTVLLSSYLYLNVFTTMCFLFISIQSTIACTPCAAAVVPSELPCRIQSVRNTTRINLYPVLTFPLSRDAFFDGLLLCELVWSEESREISVPNRRR